MPASRSRQFNLPRRARVAWWVWLLAVAVHVPVIYLLLRSANRGVPLVRSIQAMTLGDSVRVVDLPMLRDRKPVMAPGRVASPSSRAVPVMLSSATGPVPPSAAVALVAPQPVDTPPTGMPSIRPRYGDGRLWVQPLPEAPRKIASALTGQTPAEMTDSAVARIIQTYLDAMARERTQSPEALPSWTTKIGGKTVGLDQKWIYLGPLKIPTALLALLPIKMQGNMSNYQFNQQLQQMRADLFEAARRTGNYDEFKEAVKDLRQQKEREREFQKNQRTPPDSGTHG
ncbi:MAG: hypothetical protein ACREK8_10350 [Gemmatimonadales bacterium]